VKDDDGRLLQDAVPFVSFHKHARFLAEEASTTPDHEVELIARIARNLERHPLAGFVLEGGAPYGHSSPTADAVVLRPSAACRSSGWAAEGYVAKERQAGVNNLTATKARMP
jgi:hypothetical protein